MFMYQQGSVFYKFLFFVILNSLLEDKNAWKIPDTEIKVNWLIIFLKYKGYWFEFARTHCL